jgi:hypothetical protein
MLGLRCAGASSRGSWRAGRLGVCRPRCGSWRGGGVTIHGAGTITWSEGSSGGRTEGTGAAATGRAVPRHEEAQPGPAPGVPWLGA